MSEGPPKPVTNTSNENNPNEDSLQGMSRRNAILNGLGLLVGGAAVHKFGSGPKNDTENLPLPSSKENQQEKESQEQWDSQIEGYKKLYEELKWGELLFVDDFGKSLEVIKIEPKGDISPWKEGANLNEGSMSQEWLDAVRADFCTRYANNPRVTCNVANELPAHRNVTAAMREVYVTGVGDADDTKELRETIRPETFIDIVSYFGGKKVREDKQGRSRIQYILDEATDATSELPLILQAELPRILVGLAAQESHFNNAALSSRGARGVFQFMPGTWKELGYSENDFLSFTKQVEATGKYFEYIYERLNVNTKESFEVIRTQFFTSDSEFQFAFLLPVMINAYNAGPARMTAAVKWFITKYPTRESYTKVHGDIRNPYDYYATLARELRNDDAKEDILARYGDDAATYVFRIYALAELLQTKQ